MNAKIFRKSRGDIDMTQGDILRHLVTFSIPLLVGYLFQQLYNMVDTWVVGNFVSNEAYAAVGNVGPIINTLIGFFMGLSSGAGVVISQYYGARKEERVSAAVHTAVVMTVILAVVFTALGVVMTPFMLTLMDTPETVVPEAVTYLTIYFSGVSGLMIYNIGAGILRAVGDSRRPFYFLVVSAVINTVLDLVFVLAFDMGVAGVAYATVIAQGVSALLTLITLFKIDSCVRISFKRLRLHFDILWQIIKVGIPASIQMAVTSFSNIFVQSYINQFDTACMSGWTSYSKIDQLLLLPVQSLALASTTFVGQNLGVNQVERAKRGAWLAFLLSAGCMLVLMIPVLIFAPQLVAFFNNDAEVIAYGALFLRILSPFYIICCANQIYAGVLRGSGNSFVPMVIMMGSFVVFRQIYLYVVSNFISNTEIAIAMGYPAGWLLASMLIMIYYKVVGIKGGRIVKDTLGESA